MIEHSDPPYTNRRVRRVVIIARTERDADSSLSAVEVCPERRRVIADGPGGSPLPSSNSRAIVSAAASGGGKRLMDARRSKRGVHLGYAPERAAARMHLFTATIMHTGGNVMLQAFHASVAAAREEILERLCRRHGGTAAARADIRVGFHPANPLVLALVPTAVAEVIRRVERRTDRTDNHTFAVDIEQRIEA